MPSSQINEILEIFQNDPKTKKLTVLNRLVHVAVIVYRGKIIAEATNRIGYRSINEKSFYNTYIREKHNIHAEENVVRKLGDYNRLRGADMYVLKYSRKDPTQFANSKPCAKCECFLNKCMQKYGLRHVYYTSD
jgi:hypothetical protein